MKLNKNGLKSVVIAYTVLVVIVALLFLAAKYPDTVGVGIAGVVAVATVISLGIIAYKTGLD